MLVNFTLDIIPKNKKDGIGTEEFVHILKSFGWSPQQDFEKAVQVEDEILKIFAAMPPGTEIEKKSTIFFGYLQRTEFVATRFNEAQVSFWLLNPVLSQLQFAAEQMIAKILDKPDARMGFSLQILFEKAVEFIKRVVFRQRLFRISGQEVAIYENGSNFKIVIGRIISSPTSEILRNNEKDIFLCVTTAIFYLIFAFIATITPAGSSTNLVSAISNFSDAMIGAFAASLLAVFYNWWKNRSIPLIYWTFAEDPNKTK